MHVLDQERDACGIGFVATDDGSARRDVLDLVLGGLANVKHRGALAADARSSDGAGVLIPIDERVFLSFAADSGIEVSDDVDLGVVMAFLDGGSGPNADAERTRTRQILREACWAEGIDPLGWRVVPVERAELGTYAAESAPQIEQLLMSVPRDVEVVDRQRRAYRARRRAEKAAAAAGEDLYFASFGFDTVVYKALCPGDALASFYPDLADERYVVPFGIFHMRFSTNTAPSWQRAQPFRFLCHNGEINAIAGNERRMTARSQLGAGAICDDESLIRPVLAVGDSDSGMLDSALELLVRGGRDLRHAAAMLIPQAWENVPDIAAPVRDFYRFNSCLMEPWDGPAAVIATDGRRVTASLDRNGLRPLRWAASSAGLIMASSEAGAVDLSGMGEIRRGRLGPGQMLCVDPDAGGLQLDEFIKIDLAERKPYGRWVEDGLIPVGAGDTIDIIRHDVEERQRLFGWTSEEVAMIVKPMAADGKEPTFSMGDDVPIPVFGERYRPVHHYLKQRFAQVTNPPIDHLRERVVMSGRTLLGPRDPLLWEREAAARLIELPGFVIYPSTVATLTDAETAPFEPVVIDITFDVSDGAAGLEAAVDRIAGAACDAASSGVVMITLDDSAVAEFRVPAPILLAAAATHQALVDAGLRSRTSLIVDSGEVKETHHLATLIGYGVDAVCPRLAFETVAEMADAAAFGDDITAGLAQERYLGALEDGVLKIMSKMGISTVDSYRGAGIFEAISLGHDVVDKCFVGTVSVVGGATWEMLGVALLDRHAAGVGEAKLASPGLVRFRKGGEYHANNPELIEVLHESLGLESDKKRRKRDRGAGQVQVLEDTFDGGAAQDVLAAKLLNEAARTADQDLYRKFSELVNSRPATEPQDLLEFVESAEAIPIVEVEGIDEITKRFTTGAMSHGALSREAHETLAIAMNMIGGQSNCGEGGEGPDRFRTRGTDRDRNSKIKQIASGRFGVTPEYAIHADELQIKMAQGSKPGEGGQIPGHKVTEEIAELRRTQPGVTLISPPPHHDIYSIEDLAQLIFDLKQVNPDALVSVKLVSVAGVGTIAAGVAKALADGIHISGSNGGTGASPLSSIKHAGMPWILGLVETQQVLRGNDLRERVRLSVDGGFKTGRDVMIAALLGADQYSFGTAVLMAEGCIMVRACHRDTCPTGIATQREQFRAKFNGTPEMVAAYMRSVAEETRELLAMLGFRTLDEAIGRVDKLVQAKTGDPKLDSVDLRPLLRTTDRGKRHYGGRLPIHDTRSELGDRVCADAFRALWEGDAIDLEYEITNRDRTVGAALGGAVALEFSEHVPPGFATIMFRGIAGQSFGAFLTKGVDFRLVGEANDYVGKAMAGGRIVIMPPADDLGSPCLAGNTVLYGATGGELFIAGSAGERFGVRNSGATAVVEGVGQHCAEYMTGGRIVVIGDIGDNLGAGMSGGDVLVHDPHGRLQGKVNTALVRIVRPSTESLDTAHQLIERHANLTGSQRAKQLLADWDDTHSDIWRIIPTSELSLVEGVQAQAAPTAR